MNHRQNANVDNMHPHRCPQCGKIITGFMPKCPPVDQLCYLCLAQTFAADGVPIIAERIPRPDK